MSSSHDTQQPAEKKNNLLWYFLTAVVSVLLLLWLVKGCGSHKAETPVVEHGSNTSAFHAAGDALAKLIS